MNKKLYSAIHAMTIDALSRSFKSFPYKIDVRVMKRALNKHYKNSPKNNGPYWLTFEFKGETVEEENELTAVTVIGSSAKAREPQVLPHLK